MPSLVKFLKALINLLGKALNPHWATIKGPAKTWLMLGIGSILAMITTIILSLILLSTDADGVWITMKSLGLAALVVMVVAGILFMVRGFIAGVQTQSVTPQTSPFLATTKTIAIAAMLIAVGSLVFGGIVSWVQVDTKGWGKWLIDYVTILAGLSGIVFILILEVIFFGFKGAWKLVTLQQQPQTLAGTDPEKSQLDKVIRRVAAFFSLLTGIGLVIGLMPQATGSMISIPLLIALIGVVLYDISREKSWKIGELLIGIVFWFVLIFGGSDIAYDKYYCGKIINDGTVIIVDGAEADWTKEQCSSGRFSLISYFGNTYKTGKITILVPASNQEMQQGTEQEMKFKIYNLDQNKISEFRVMLQIANGTPGLIATMKPEKIEGSEEYKADYIQKITLPKNVSGTVGAKVQINAIDKYGDVLVSSDDDSGRFQIIGNYVPASFPSNNGGKQNDKTKAASNSGKSSGIKTAANQNNSPSATATAANGNSSTGNKVNLTDLKASINTTCYMNPNIPACQK